MYTIQHIDELVEAIKFYLFNDNRLNYDINAITFLYHILRNRTKIEK